jgi:hypothetical protein
MDNGKSCKSNLIKLKFELGWVFAIFRESYSYSISVRSRSRFGTQICDTFATYSIKAMVLAGFI